MPAMIPLQMHITPLCLVCLEGNISRIYMHVTPLQAKLSCISTHKILGISTISRAEHSVAQTREQACTKVVIPQVQARGLCTSVAQKIVFIILYTDLTITEVAHDIHSGVTNYVTKTLKLVNSYDTWHGNLYACLPCLCLH